MTNAMSSEFLVAFKQETKGTHLNMLILPFYFHEELNSMNSNGSCSLTPSPSPTSTFTALPTKHTNKQTNQQTNIPPFFPYPPTFLFSTSFPYP